MTRRVAALVAAVALVALAGCTDAPRDPSPSRSPSSTADAGELAALIAEQGPPGFVAVPEETGPVSLDDVVEGADDPEANRERLADHGFRRGFRRTWHSDDDSASVIYALVYEFAGADGARDDLATAIAEAKAGGDRLFEVPGIEGATGITHLPPPGADGDDATFHAVVFVRGARYFLVTIGGPTEHTTDQAVEIARTLVPSA